MQVDINLDLKAKQKLVMTPKLQMAVKILQYNSIELKEFINEEAKENPIIEIIENKSDQAYDNSMYSGIRGESYNYENFIADSPKLCESLEQQLFEVLDDDEKNLGKFIVGNLNKDGELSYEEKEIAQLYFNSQAKKDINKVKKVYKKIKSLNLQKGLNSINPCAEFVEADFQVKRTGTSYDIISNNDNYYNLKISSYYFNLLKNSDDPKVKDYLKEKYKKALWLIKSIEQRRDTIIKILEAIIDRQYDFFEYGLKYLYTMTMQEIAESIEMHESTVSRATTGKYIQTPHGTVPFKIFFNSGIDNLSSISIKAIITELITKEEKNNPLSDVEIMNYFVNNYELNISRRTIAKYRKALGIKGSRARTKK